MPDIITPAIGELLKIGLPGVIIAALAWAYWRQVLRNEALSDRRVEDAQKLTELVRANTESREKHTAAIDSLADLMRDVQIRGRR